MEQARRTYHLGGRQRFALVVTMILVAEGCATHRAPAATPSSGGTAFVATAYCQGTTTAAGIRVRRGIVAADPAVLPLGAMIRIAQSGHYDGVYQVMDTGPKVRGHRLDLFVESCAAAKGFGRRTVRVWVVDGTD